VMGAGQQGGQQGGAAGGIGGLLGSVLAQATQGLKQGGQDLNTASGGMGDKLKGMASQAAGGRSPQDLMQQAREMIARNPGMAAAAAAGLAGLLLGTKSGRGLAMGAAQVGGLALIGGLAYKAFQNHQAGAPVMGDAATPALAAPAGSGFEPEAASNETAILLIRAMIAGAASDGQVDAHERQSIIGGLTEAGFDPEGNAWLEGEMANPASLEDLAAGATTPELAAQVYTAARLAIEPDTQDEVDFLANLGAALGLDPSLVSQIDEAAAGVKA